MLIAVKVSCESCHEGSSSTPNKFVPLTQVNSPYWFSRSDLAAPRSRTRVMGIFSKSSEAAAPDRRPGATTTPLKAPASSTVPVSHQQVTEAQEQQYKVLLEYLLSNEHGQNFSEEEQFYMTRDQLLRFCRATKWDLAKTKARLLGTLKWRREYGVDRITAEHVEPEARTGKQVILGFDNAQRPCLYLFPGRQNTEVSPRQVQFLVWCLERVVDIMPSGVENLALLVNYKGSTGDKNPGIGQGREVLNILQTHYVETLGRALVINIPFFVWGFFKLITPFIDPLTREKLKFNEDMTQHVPKAQLDSEFGGEVIFDYVQEDYWPALLKMCQDARQHKLRNYKALGGGIGQRESDLKKKDSAHDETSTSNGSKPAPSVDAHENKDLGVSGTAQKRTGDTVVEEANTTSASSEPVKAVYTNSGPAAAPTVARAGLPLGDAPKG